MPPPAPPASAQGLSDEHLHAEEKWLSEWIQAANSMDWSQWERFWDDDAFLQFCDTPKLEGRDAIARHWRDRFSYLDRFEHTRILRRSFDVTSELIYQTELLNYRIKGDPKARDIEVHALAVIHKKVGSDTVTGFEAYFDQQPIVEVVQVSAPGLTQDQIQAERIWLDRFMQDTDSLDWSRWGKWWADDAFIQFGNTPKIEGKESIQKYMEPQLGILELMYHEATRISFDVPLGLIYQTTIITYKVKGDLQGRSIQVPGLAVIHKQVGENVLKGFEVYIDREPVAAVVKEVLEGRGAE
ncbi:hypothetical protein BN14_03577 [Rhizoctonia solani AG-1 IB]|uniref:SnoaL-like domain-containing protein n=2 Tax=Thanatephorus cucumeris (strain AG1-IB / isolate 7/3/14) TaxID=1108050 RepID=M5BQU7_THACB|nr:hypothetical protein BN14_03577 [Rhizoctonia solani AG-1 IB]